MNNVSLKDLEKEQDKFKKKYGIDSRTLKKYRSGIAKVSKEESDKLASELYDYILTNKEITEEIARDYMMKGANPNYVITLPKSKGDTLLIRCIKLNYLFCALELLKAGADPNLCNDYKSSPLMWAVRKNSVDGNIDQEIMVKILILMGADVNAQCLDGDTALTSARRHGQDNAAKLLINAGAFLNHLNLSNASPSDVSFQVSSHEVLEDVLNERRKRKKKVTEEDTMSLIDDASKSMGKVKKIQLKKGDK